MAPRKSKPTPRQRLTTRRKRKNAARGRSSTLSNDPVTIILGKMKSGKTYRAKQLATRATTGTIWIWDPNREYRTAEGFDFSDWWTIRDYDGGVDAIARGHPYRRVVWQVDEDEFPRWVALVQGGGNLVAFIDEAHDSCGRVVKRDLLKFLRRPRHSNVRVVLIAQRPMAVNVSLRSQATRVIAFRLTESNDLDWLRGHCSKEFGERLPNLGKWESEDYSA